MLLGMGAVVLGSLILYPSTTQALSLSQESKNALRNNLPERCDIVTKNIDTQISKYNQFKQRHVERYESTKTKVKAAVEKAKDSGANTSKLESDLVNLDSQIKNFASDYAKFISTLEQSKQYVCGDASAQFKDALQEARSKLIVVRQDTANIRNYVQTVVRPDIQEVRQQLKK